MPLTEKKKKKGKNPRNDPNRLSSAVVTFELFLKPTERQVCGGFSGNWGGRV